MGKLIILQELRLVLGENLPTSRILRVKIIRGGAGNHLGPFQLFITGLENQGVPGSVYEAPPNLVV